MCYRHRTIFRVALAAAVLSCTGGSASSDDTFLWDALNHCLNGITPVSTCLKVKVLRHLDTELKIDTPRSLEDIDEETLDAKLVKRFQKYLRSSEVRIPLPTYFFEGATLVFGKDRELTDFDVEFPAEVEDVSENKGTARATKDSDQHKMILPLLLMLKMKLKMITPILLMLVSVKAAKALVFSKIALLLVIAFLVGQLLKKLKMEIPMLLAMEKMTASSAQPYGPPPPPLPSAYGEPSPVTSWEPSASASSNSYSSRVSDPHQMAYNSYYNSPSSSPSKTTS